MYMWWWFITTSLHNVICFHKSLHNVMFSTTCIYIITSIHVLTKKNGGKNKKKWEKHKGISAKCLNNGTKYTNHNYYVILLTLIISVLLSIFLTPILVGLQFLPHWPHCLGIFDPIDLVFLTPLTPLFWYFWPLFLKCFDHFLTRAEHSYQHLDESPPPSTCPPGGKCPAVIVLLPQKL